MTKAAEIRNEGDYEAVLARISELMDALSGPQGQITDANHWHRIELIHLSAKSNSTRTSTTRSTLPGPVRLSNSTMTKPA